MKVTCGFPESEKFCPFEREIRGKKRAFVFPHSMNVWLKILQFYLYLDYYSDFCSQKFHRSWTSTVLSLLLCGAGGKEPTC